MSIIDLFTGRGRLVIASGLAAASLACFTKEDVRGLPCLEDAHCGDLLKCEQGVCGGVEQQYGADPCETQVNECADANTLSRCIGGQQTDTPCELYCSTLGLTEALGCFESPSTGSADCHCREDSSSCTDLSGRRTCTEQTQRNLTQCVGSSTQYTDCDQYCRSLGVAAYSCSDDGVSDAQCQCLDAICFPGGRYCLDDQTMALCTDDQWSEVLCSDVCEGGISLGCGYSSAEDDFMCLCVY